MKDFVGKPNANIVAKIDENALFGVTGHIGLRGFYDVDGDGEKEFICNIGSAADFRAIKLSTMSVVWSNTQDTTSQKEAYFPKIVRSEGLAIYGNRNDSTIYAINLSDGTLAWSKTLADGVIATEFSDWGVLAGNSVEVTALDFSDGSVLSGWPVNFGMPVAQGLSAGDVDGDGVDEIVMSDNSGNIEVHNRDGSLVFSLSSNHTHVDWHIIGNVQASHTGDGGNELLTVVDDDNSVTGEGDEITTYLRDGSQAHKYTCASNGPSIAVANMRSDYEGNQIVFGLENNGNVGLLDGELNEIWTVDPPTDNAGQLGVADINGDEQPEIIVNTGEGSNSSYEIIDRFGNYLGRFQGHGWDLDPLCSKKTGAIGGRRFPDVNGDGKDEIHGSLIGANNQIDNDIIYILNR